MTDDKNKEKVLEALSEDKEKSTNKVAEDSGLNWYRAERILNKLFDKDKIEKDKKPAATYWKKK